jgi:hypothetical protein
VLKADLHRPPFAEGAQRWHAHHARDSRAGRLCH